MARRAMPPPTIADSLAATPQFSMLDRALLDRIAAGSRVVAAARGDLLMREGEPCRAFFLVRTGGVRIFRAGPDGKEQLLQRLRPGQTFAEAAVLSMPRYPACAEATATPTEVVEVGREAFLRVYESDPRVARAMIASLSHWLMRLVGRVEDLTVASAGARLARYLLDLPARGKGGPLEIEIPVAKKELAALLGITPETLSRLLRKWRERRIVRIAGRRVVVRDPDTLVALASDEGDAAA